MCIPLEKVCNRKNDCGGWQDEPKGLCHINECLTESFEGEHSKNGNREKDTREGHHLTVVGGGCDQQCVDLPIGFKCACDKGFKLVDDKKCVGKS